MPLCLARIYTVKKILQYEQKLDRQIMSLMTIPLRPEDQGAITYYFQYLISENYL